MALTVTASLAAYLSQISDSTTSTPFDAGGADFLVVAVGWTDATGGTPTVTFGGQALSPLTSPQPSDADGIAAIFLLANPPAGSQPLVVQSLSSFIGNTQFNAVGLKGSAGTIGVTAAAAASGTTATLTLTGSAADSVLLGFCVSLWDGVQVVDASTGWTQLTTASGSDGSGNGFSFSFQAPGGPSAPAFTVTPEAGGYPQYFAIAIEIKAAAVVTAPVPVTASTTAYLGVISNSSVTTAFDCSGANLLVVAVACADQTGGVPAVTYAGQQMTPILDPRPATSLGAVYYFLLETPPAGSNPLVVGAASYIGFSQLAAWGLSGAAGTIGVRASAIQQQPGAVAITLPGTTAGSTLLGSVASFYSQPATLTPPFGWTQNGTATGASGSIFAYSSYTSGADETLSVTPPTYAQMIATGIEVFQTGHVVASPPVTITASSVTDIGAIGLGTGTVAFDATGAKMLVACVAYGNNSALPAISYGGVPMAFLPKPTISTATVGTMAVAVLMEPPAGAQDFTVTGHSGYFGDTIVMLAGVAGLSGAAGVLGSVFHGGEQIDLSFAGSSSSSLILAFAAAQFARSTAVVSEGWTEQASVAGANANGWFYTAPGAANAAIELLQPAFSSTQIAALELRADIQGAPAVTATVQPALPAFALRVTGIQQLVPAPAGQQFHMYLETWLRNPPWPNPKPGDFDLANLPASIGNVCLSFGIPLCTYVDLTSDIKATVGLNWPGSAQLLKDTIALLKSRCPNTQVTLCVQQNTPEVTNDEPYSPTGWGGMTAANVACMLKFLQDMNMDGIVIDYECLSLTEDIAHHCTTAADGSITCYTDTEQLAVIKMIRAGIPRPYIVILDALHVGCYGEGEFIDAVPQSFNGGYNLCLTKDPVALAALDGIHIETYDAGGGYDPRVALQAFQFYFPTTPLYVGLRVGPPDNGGYRRTLAELTDYTNNVVMRNAAGMFCYAAEWPFDDPTGDVGPLCPDSNMVTYMVASRLGLAEANRPLISSTARLGGPSSVWLYPNGLPNGIS